MKKLVIGGFLAVLMLAGGSSAWAQQTTSGDVTGIVKDKSGAVVANASITLTSETNQYLDDGDGECKRRIPSRQPPSRAVRPEGCRAGLSAVCRKGSLG